MVKFNINVDISGCVFHELIVEFRYNKNEIDKSVKEMKYRTVYSFVVKTQELSKIRKCYKPFCYTFKIGFHVTSYQANFASHHTRGRHVGFLFTWSGIEKYNKISRYFLSSSNHNSKLQPSDKNISTHTR